MNTAKLSAGIKQLSLSAAIMLRGAAERGCANTSLVTECYWGHLGGLFWGRQSQRCHSGVLEYHPAAACSGLWSKMAITNEFGSSLQLIFMLNIAQGRLVMLSFLCTLEDLNTKLGEFYCGCSLNMPNTTLFYPLIKSWVLYALPFACSSFTKSQRALGLSTASNQRHI